MAFIKVKVLKRGNIFKRGIERKLFIGANNRALKRTVDAGAKLIKRELPKATGDLAQGVRGRVKSPRLGIIQVEGSRADIMPIIERGRRPTGGGGFLARTLRGLGLGSSKSFEPIKAWVRLVINPKNLNQVAFLVFRKIHREGFEGKHIFKRSRPRIGRFARRFFREEYRKVARELSR